MCLLARAVEEMMRSKKVLLVLTTISILLILSVACSKGQTTIAPVENPGITQESLTPTEEITTQVSAPEGPPEDVPIMPDAYELQAANQLNVIYKVNAPIKDIVEFYQQELPNYGWDQTNNPDSVVGSMAQMSRSKSNGDRITFSLQYNPIGEFTIVQIFLTRAP
jgi:hypothetical protein